MADFKAPKGLGSNLFKSGLYSLYQELTKGPKSFRPLVSERMKETLVYDSERGKEVSLYDLAKHHGLENELDHYIQQEFSSQQAYIGKALHIVTNFKDGLEDLISAAELGADVAAGAPTAGTGTCVVEIGSKLIELPIYVVTQSLYTALSGILGFSGKIYERNLKGARQYAWDTTKGFAGALGSTIPFLGTALEFLTNPDDKTDRIATALSKNVHQRLLQRIRGETSLEERLQAKPGILQRMTGGLKEYAHLTDGYVQDWYHNGYETVPAT